LSSWVRKNARVFFSDLSITIFSPCRKHENEALLVIVSAIVVAGGIALYLSGKGLQRAREQGDQ